MTQSRTSNTMAWKAALLATVICVVSIQCLSSDGKEGTSDQKGKTKKKKDIRDYSEADMQRLYDEWEENDNEPLPLDELPEWDPRKPRQELDFSDPSKFADIDDYIKMSKKGKTLMMFVEVTRNPDRKELEELTSLWQTGLWNSHIQCERFVLDDNRAIFKFDDGTMAWEAKDFLVEQERVLKVVIEQKTYYGKHTDEYKDEEKKALHKTEKSKKKKKKKSKVEKKTGKTEL